MLLIRDAGELAVQRLRARPGRALMMALGPLLAVLMTVGAIGFVNNSRNSIRAEFDRLGRNVVLMGSGFDGTAATLMDVEAVERVDALATVDRVAAVGVVLGQVARTRADGQIIGERVFSARGVTDLLAVEGQGLDRADEANALTRAVVGTEVASRIPNFRAGRSLIVIGSHRFVVVGVLESTPPTRHFDTGVFIGTGSAHELFATDPGWAEMFVSVEPDAMDATVSLLGTVASPSGTPPVAVRTIGSLMSAQVAVDQTLQRTILILGALAVAIGAVGIANVMAISVVQRRSEIGVMQAIGHPRQAIAAQFVIEGGVAALTGAAVGALAATAMVESAARLGGHPAIHDHRLAAMSVLLAGATGVVAAALPARAAARIEPAVTLRAD